jgi:N-acetylmuramic acid 6-phosphate etherase
MVDMQLSNNKLVDRAEKMLMNELKISLDEAKKIASKTQKCEKIDRKF